MLYAGNRNGKFGHSEILFSGSQGNPPPLPNLISVVLVHINVQSSFSSNSEIDFPGWRWKPESERRSIQKTEKAKIFPIQYQRCASPVPTKNMTEST